MQNNILDTFRKRPQQYKDTFNTPQGKEVLRDLAKFCGQNNPTYVPGDSHASAYKEGMRRVFLRIQQFVNLSEKDLHTILNQPQGE